MSIRLIRKNVLAAENAVKSMSREPYRKDEKKAFMKYPKTAGAVHPA